MQSKPAHRWVPIAHFFDRYAAAVSRGFLVATVIALALLWVLQPAALLHRNFVHDRPPPDRAYVGQKVYQTFALQSPDVLILGGSSMREMIPAPDLKSGGWQALCAGQARLLNAATSSQHPSDGYAIVDALPSREMLVVVGLNSRRLTVDKRSDPFDLSGQTVELPRSAQAARAALHHGRFDVGAFDFFDQIRRVQWSLQSLYLSTRGTSFAGSGAVGPGQPRDDRSAYPDAPLSPEEKQLIADKLLLTSLHYEKTAPRPATEYWLDFGRYIRASGGNVLFVRTPRSPEAQAYDRTTASLSEAALLKIGQEFPVLDFVKLPSAAGLGAVDFHDPVHVSHAGRDRLWPTLARSIAATKACPPRARAPS